MEGMRFSRPRYHVDLLSRRSVYCFLLALRYFLINNTLALHKIAVRTIEMVRRRYARFSNYDTKKIQEKSMRLFKKKTLTGLARTCG